MKNGISSASQCAEESIWHCGQGGNVAYYVSCTGYWKYPHFLQQLWALPIYNCENEERWEGKIFLWRLLPLYVGTYKFKRIFSNYSLIKTFWDQCKNSFDIRDLSSSLLIGSVSGYKRTYSRQELVSSSSEEVKAEIIRLTDKATQRTICLESPLWSQQVNKKARLCLWQQRGFLERTWRSR